MTQLVTALRKVGDWFKYLCGKMHPLSEAKLEGGIFVGEIFVNCSNFEENMSTKEKEA